MKTISDAIQHLKAEMMEYFDSKTERILGALNGIETSLSTMGDHLVQLEQRVASNEDNIAELSTRVVHLEKENAYLMDKVDDLENRSRSSNLRIIRVPEASEGRDMLGFMADFILQLLGSDGSPAPPPIERAHRNPAFRRHDMSHPGPS